MLIHHPACHFFFFFNDTATTEIYTLSLHDALPISTGLADGTGRSQFGGNLIPVDRLSPQAVAILKAFPQPQNGSLTHNFIAAGSGPYTQNSFYTREHWTLSPTLQIFARVSLDYLSLSGK